jgi:lipoprotein-anchoring transpeptidase ErfK/SrfK
MNRRQALLIIVLIILAIAGGIFFFTKKHVAKTAAPVAVFAIKEAEDLIGQNKLAEGRKVYKDALPKLEDKPEAFKDAQKRIEALDMQVLMSPQVDENSIAYEVKSGDSLAKIARQNNTTVDLIKKINHLQGNTLRLGQKLKVINAKFYLVVDKAQNTLVLKRGDETIKTYLVATGKNSCTPVGAFKITNKLVDPTWFKAGMVLAANSPENILGPRWMGLDAKGYGIHGTVEPDKLGQQVSEGCIRMRNDELIELYDIIPSGTEVTITD